MHDIQTRLTQPAGVSAVSISPGRRNGLLLQMAEERAARLAAARLQMEQEVADATAHQNCAQVHSVAQPEGSKSQHASAELTHAGSESQTAAAEATQARSDGEAGESQAQLLSDIRDFVKMARDGIKQRQVALQYARTTWQVQTAPICTYLPATLPCLDSLAMPYPALPSPALPCPALHCPALRAGLDESDPNAQKQDLRSYWSWARNRPKKLSLLYFVSAQATMLPEKPCSVNYAKG